MRWRGGSYRLNFDLHRAFGLWTWGFLFVLAFTAFSLNLYREVFFPVMSVVSNVTPSPFDVRTPKGLHEPIAPRVEFEQIVPVAVTEAQRRGWEQPAGDVFYSREYGIYGVRFFRPEDGHGAAGVGHPALYYDALDGRLLGDREPWKGTAADIFVQAQFPIHSGRILGLPGRILISLMGLVVAGLSVTGVIVWWRKRQARLWGPARIAHGVGARARTHFRLVIRRAPSRHRQQDRRDGRVRRAISARPGRFELPTPGSVDRCSIQLSYGRVLDSEVPGSSPSLSACQARSGRVRRVRALFCAARTRAAAVR